MEQGSAGMDKRKQIWEVIWLILIIMALLVAYVVINKHTLVLSMIYQIAILAVFILFSFVFGITIFKRKKNTNKQADWLATLIVSTMSFTLVSLFLIGRTKWALLLILIPQIINFAYLFHRIRHSDGNINSE